jgi:hypothetical protein
MASDQQEPVKLQDQVSEMEKTRATKKTLVIWSID